jgi:hypothetical protein
MYVSKKGLVFAILIKYYSVSQLHEVHFKTSPPAPLLSKERGDKAQLYRGEVKLTLLNKYINQCKPNQLQRLSKRN